MQGFLKTRHLRLVLKYPHFAGDVVSNMEYVFPYGITKTLESKISKEKD